MADIILYDYWRSSASYRVRIVLNLKGLAYQARNISLIDGDQRSAEYLWRNPQGLVPMLSINGHDLTQSLAIIEYLDAEYPEPPMLPSDPAARARTLAQAMVIIAEIHPINNLRILQYLKNELGLAQPQIDSWYRHWISESFSALEKMAPVSGFFGGRAPNLVDVCLVPQVYNARRFETELGAFPNLVRIDAACNQLAAFQQAAPEAVKE